MGHPFDAGYYHSEELRGFGFAHVGENVLVAKTCKIVGLENISIGDNSRIDDFCTIIGSGPLAIGNSVHIHSYCQIGARGGVTLGDYSALASGCFIYYASDDAMGRHMVGGVVPEHCTKPKVAPVRLERHTVAFARCTILPGVTMHEGAIACAHSLVSRSLPEWMIAQGSPATARIPRPRTALALEASIATLRSEAA